MVYLQITPKIAEANRAAAGGVYQEFKAPFPNTIPGASRRNCWCATRTCRFCMASTAGRTRTLTCTASCPAGLVGGLEPLLNCAPDLRMYQAA